VTQAREDLDLGMRQTLAQASAHDVLHDQVLAALKSGSTGVGESHHAIMNGESGSMGSRSLRIAAA
jgi:hypothetical protein